MLSGASSNALISYQYGYYGTILNDDVPRKGLRR